MVVPSAGFGTTVDSRDFLETSGPAFEPCSACGTKPSFYRETWVKGMTERRRLCKWCYGAAVERERAVVKPLPRMIAAGSMKRIATSIGGCGLCGVEAATWSDDGVQFCEACYRGEVLRWLEDGKQSVPA